MTVFHKYAQLKSQIQALEIELDGLKPDVIKAMGKKEKIENGFGTFQMITSQSFEFSVVFKRAVQRLKENEIANGIAKPTLTKSLRYNFPQAIVK